ncbi:MAG: hypothetical protein EOP89_15825 [Lysobacteraceae bacterium]|nr:MAG: hypothetical protein EOP89_15825 [Xanthomonadaceae bacterium]
MVDPTGNRDAVKIQARRDARVRRGIAVKDPDPATIPLLDADRVGQPVEAFHGVALERHRQRIVAGDRLHGLAELLGPGVRHTHGDRGAAVDRVGADHNRATAFPRPSRDMGHPPLPLRL